MRSWGVVLIALIWLLALSTVAFAQAPLNGHAEANEAVTVKAGVRSVELPPAAVDKNGKPLPRRAATFALASAPFVYMIETSEQLMECSEFELRAEECRPSTLGQQVLTRTWIVKREGRWWLCAGPERAAECLDPPAFNGGRGNASFRHPSSKR